MVVKKTKDVPDIVWIGGKYIGDEVSTAGSKGPENWIWTDGSTWDFEDWAYPNGPTGRGECLKLRPLDDSDELRNWNDEDCESKKAAIYKCCNQSSMTRKLAVCYAVFAERQTVSVWRASKTIEEFLSSETTVVVFNLMNVTFQEYQKKLFI